MRKSTSISNILQSVIPKEKILPFLQELEYVDVARKFTVYDLFLFLAEASFHQWGGIGMVKREWVWAASERWTIPRSLKKLRKFLSSFSSNY